MTDPLTYAHVAASYAPIQKNIKVGENKDPFFEKTSQAKDIAMTKTLYRFNAQLIETSSEAFAQSFASDQDQDNASDIMDTLAQANNIQQKAFNLQVKSEYLGTTLNMVT